MVKFYYYKHPNTGEIFSDQRMSSAKDVPYIAADGKKCQRVDYTPPPKKNDPLKAFGVVDKNAEVFKAAPDYVKQCRPKYIKFRDGHREKYDPTKHC